MTILFICGSLEPGKDGVGDYTRRLVQALLSRGHSCSIAAINDTYIEGISLEETQGSGRPTVLRLPATLPWPARINELNRIIQKLKPTAISWQFVIYGYHPKGLPFTLVKQVKRMHTPSECKRHLMLHELWIGQTERASLSHRIYGCFQKHLVLKLIQHFRPTTITTNTAPYQDILMKKEIRAERLPLFSNILKSDHSSLATSAAASFVDSVFKDTEDTIYFGVFGSIQAGWNAKKTLAVIAAECGVREKKACVIFMGLSGKTQSFFEDLEAERIQNLSIISLGEQSNERLNLLFQHIDYGLALVDADLIQKSGSAAAFWEFNIPVLYTNLTHFYSKEISSTEKMTAFGPYYFVDRSHFASVDTVCDQLLRSISG